MNFVVAMCRVAESKAVRRRSWHASYHVKRDEASGAPVLSGGAMAGRPCAFLDVDTAAEDWEIYEAPVVMLSGWRALKALEEGKSLHSPGHQYVLSNRGGNVELRGYPPGPPPAPYGFFEFLATTFEVR